MAKSDKPESLVIQLPTAIYRRLRFNVQSGGVAVFGLDVEGQRTLLYCGDGKAKVRVTGAYCALEVQAFEGVPYEIEVPELRDVFAGWTNGPSLTDLSPRPFGVVTPEIQAVIDQMNRNAIIREQAMLRAFKSRTQ